MNKYASRTRSLLASDDEAVVVRFEMAWRGALLGAVLPDVRQLALSAEMMAKPADRRAQLIFELVLVDLEYRWRLAKATGARNSSPSGPLLEAYGDLLRPIQPGKPWPWEMIEEEILARRRCGMPPTEAEYVRRFPQQSSMVRDFFQGRLRRVATPRPDNTESLKSGESDVRPASESSATEAMPTIDHYRCLRRIGEGGFGVVYEAHDAHLARKVALKLPRPDRALSPAECRRYLEEARKVAALDDPHVVPVYQAGPTSDGRWYVVSKLMEAGSLDDKLDALPRGERLPAHAAARIVADTARALQAAHRAGIVHRDVKPANIMLDGNGRAYLTDFGCALSEKDFGVARGTEGTLHYLSPEQASGDGHLVDGRSDIYSLGVVLYRLLTGQSPYQGASRSNRSALLDQIRRVPVRPLRQLDEQVPPELEAICLKALAKSPENRYPTAVDIAVALETWLSMRDDGVRLPADSRSGFGARQISWALSAAGAAIVVCLVLWATNEWFEKPSERRDVAQDVSHPDNTSAATVSIDSPVVPTVGPILSSSASATDLEPTSSITPPPRIAPGGATTGSTRPIAVPSGTPPVALASYAWYVFAPLAVKPPSMPPEWAAQSNFESANVHGSLGLKSKVNEPTTATLPLEPMLAGDFAIEFTLQGLAPGSPVALSLEGDGEPSLYLSIVQSYRDVSLGVNDLPKQTITTAGFSELHFYRYRLERNGDGYSLIVNGEYGRALSFVQATKRFRALKLTFNSIESSLHDLEIYRPGTPTDAKTRPATFDLTIDDPAVAWDEIGTPIANANRLRSKPGQIAIQGDFELKLVGGFKGSSVGRAILTLHGADGAPSLCIYLQWFEHLARLDCTFPDNVLSNYQLDAARPVEVSIVRTAGNLQLIVEGIAVRQKLRNTPFGDFDSITLDWNGDGKLFQTLHVAPK